MSLPLGDCLAASCRVPYVVPIFIQSEVFPERPCDFFFDSWEIFGGLLFHFESFGGLLDIVLSLTSGLILIWRDNMLIKASLFQHTLRFVLWLRTRLAPGTVLCAPEENVCPAVIG